MKSQHCLRQLCLAIGLAILASTTAWSADKPAAVEDFSVMHFTDVHVNPHLTRTGPPGAVRGAKTLRWIREQAREPQAMLPDGETVPPPALAICTGDLTEYGVVDDTWQIFESALKNLPCPLYVLPGNHDNTWGSLYAVMRERHGGENYSFDHGGVHFVCISSASPQEPVPSIDAKTRAWLKTDLDRIPADTPVVLSLHHPLYGNELANPAEHDTLVDMLRDYNVIMMLYGHGHAVSHRMINGIHGVMGGETWRKNPGYGIISFRDDKVRYAYHYMERPADDPNDPPGPRWEDVCEFKLRRKAPRRLLEIKRPLRNDVVSGKHMNVRMTAAAPRNSKDTAEVKLLIDGEEVASTEMETQNAAIRVPLANLTPGAHLLSVTIKRQGGYSDVRTRIFHVEDPKLEVVWRSQLHAAVKAAPVMFEGKLVVADNLGCVRGLDPDTGRTRWTFGTGGEILGTPIVAAGKLITGSGDGKVYALNGAGELAWLHIVGRPVYGWPVADDDTVYIGDLEGRLHALNLADGTPRWVFERADFCIESKPVIWDDLVVFGAWDGYMYALNRKDGTQAWKAPGPMVSGGKSRYYAPADCGPIVIGEQLVVCDRGYMVGTYSRAGEVLNRWDNKIAGISSAADSKTYYARSTVDIVGRYDLAGEAAWQAEIPAGRFPIPPTEHDGRLYVCSNRGLLSVLDADSGQALWSYQATPGFFVMSPVTVIDKDGQAPTCVVAGMDGWLTAVRQR